MKQSGAITVTPEAAELHDSSLVLDCHSHFLINGYLLRRPFNHKGASPRFYNPLKNALSLDKVRRGGLNALAFTTYTPGRPFFRKTDAATHRILDRYQELLRENPELLHCTTADQITEAWRQGRIAAFPAIEGAHVLEGRLENIDRFYDRGVRIVTLTHFISNGIADAAQSPWKPLGGLSSFGREVVQRMQQLGMLVDVAHCSDEALKGVMAAATGPVVCTHSGLRRFRNIKRNLDHWAVKAIAESGGLFGVILFPNYLGRAGTGGTNLRAAAATARAVAEIADPSIICLGSDMDGYTWLPRGMADASDMPQFTQALLDAGFNKDEVVGILGGNFLRVFKKVCG